MNCLTHHKQIRLRTTPRGLEAGPRARLVRWHGPLADWVKTRQACPYMGTFTKRDFGHRSQPRESPGPKAGLWGSQRVSKIHS